MPSLGHAVSNSLQLPAVAKDEIENDSNMT